VVSSPSPERAALLLVGAACVVAVARYGELSGGAFVAVTTTGVALAAVAVRRRVGESAPRVGRRARPWAGWLLAAAICELYTLADDDVPTISDLLDPALAHSWLRGLATVAWLAGGAWLLSRPRGEAMRP
jgi:hypothetical protein